jgi:hypothetical protein
VLDRPVLAAAYQLGGQLAVERYQRQVASEHVVQVAGEAQPLLGHRQPRLHVPRAVDLPQDSEIPHGDAVDQDGSPDPSQIDHRPQPLMTVAVVRAELQGADDRNRQGDGTEELTPS